MVGLVRNRFGLVVDVRAVIGFARSHWSERADPAATNGDFGFQASGREQIVGHLRQFSYKVLETRR
jgi:hypothetical protein